MSRDIRPTSLDHVALWVDGARAAGELPVRPARHACHRGDGHLHARRSGRQARQADAVRRGGPARARRARANRAAGRQVRPPTSSPRTPDGVASFEGPGRGAARARRAPRRGLRPRPRRAPPARPRRRARRARGHGLRAPQRGAGRERPRAAGGRRRRAEGERPLLNHIALLVDSAAEVQRDAEARGVEIDDVKDAPNTLAVFLRGPSGVRIEYVEHKPGFALV